MPNFRKVKKLEELTLRDFIVAWVLLSTIAITIRMSSLEDINTTGEVVHKYTCLKEPFKIYRIAVNVPEHKIITTKVTKEEFANIDIGDKVKVETLIYKR